MPELQNRQPNRLIHEKSPYLLQHAYNPVSWYPWGDEAFEKAASEDKLVFLSIGYATCHWCHVMERESFEDEETADVLNEHFVPVKVDREERPDIDSIYMDALHAMGQQGGWPLSMFITDNGKPPALPGRLPEFDICWSRPSCSFWNRSKFLKGAMNGRLSESIAYPMGVQIPRGICS